jgi:uncharacterized membrane protein
MEDLIGALCVTLAMAMMFVVPLAAFLVPLKLWADLGTLRRRLVVLEDDVDTLRAQLDARVAPAALPAPVAVAVDEVAALAAADPTRSEAEAPGNVEDVEDDARADATAPSSDEPDALASPVDDAPGEDVDPEDAAPEESVADAVVRPAAWRPPSPERIAVLLGASIGGVALLIGLVLGLVAVLEAGILGPAARVTGGLLTGTFLWVLGASLRGRLVAVPSALAGAGMGTLFGAIFSAHSLYGLIGPTQTFLALVLVSFVAGLRATVLADRFMAYLGLFGGLLAPLAVSTGENGAVGLFAFLFLLTVATLSSAVRRRWPDLVVACLLGTGALYAGWTATWLAPDSVRVAFVAAFALSLPYAFGAARTDGDGPLDHSTRWATGVGALVFMGLALPWFVPLDTMFVDPRSGVTVLQSPAGTRWAGAIALALLPVPAWLASRARHSTLASSATTLLTAVLSLVWVTGWSTTLDRPDALSVLAPLFPLVVGLLVHVRRRRDGVALGLLLAPWTIAWISSLATGLTPTVLALSLVLATALSVVGVFVSTTSPLLLALLAAGAVALGFASMAEAAQTLGFDVLDERLAFWNAGSILLLLGVVPVASLAPRWRQDRLPPLGWLPGIAAGVALFPAAYATWQTLLGTSFIGALPVLLGGHALLATAVLTRVHRLQLTHPLVLVAVSLVLAGVTFALPIQLDSQWLTVGWALEGAALAALSTRIRHPLVRWTATFLGIAVGVRLLFNPYALSYGTAGGWPILNWTLYTWGVPTLSLVATAALLERSSPEGRRDELEGAPSVLRLLAMGTGFALVNVQVSHAFQDAGPLDLAGTTMLQGMVRSLAWGGWGLFLLLLGLGVGSRMTRFVGFAFLLLAAAKVFVYDLWAMPGLVRVGSLIGLGVTLLVSAVLFNRLVLREPAHPGES